MTDGPIDRDQRLVAALQESPRASIVALARAIHEPRAVVADHLHRLLESGSIRIVATIHPRFAGLDVIAHVSVSTRGPVAEVTDLVASWPECVFVSVVAGSHDFIMEVRVGTHDELQALLARVREHAAVDRINTAVYSGLFKGYLGYDTFTEIRIDDLDRRLLRMLQRDGRAAWNELAAEVGRSPSAVRARVHRMLDARIARIVVVQERGRLGRGFTMGVGMTLRSDAGGVLSRLRDDERVEFAVATVGRFDSIITLRGAHPVELDAALEWLRTFPEVTGVDAWTHLRSVKEDYARRI